MVFMKRWRVLLGLALLGILAVEAGPGQPPLRTGTIVMGVPRDGFVVLGADRLWSNALPRSDDPPSERQGRQVKIAVHDSLPLAIAAAGIATLGGLASLSDAELRAVLPGQVGRLLRDRARGIDPRDLELDAERISISTEETFERDLRERHVLHAELRRMAEDVAAHLRRDGLSARTVTTKLRYSDFSIRSRSTTLPTPIDEAERIGELACRLLDRGLRDRPGALRLVGVGVSGLETHRQLELV